MTTLFDPIRIGDIELANRIVMAPLSRNRAAPGQVPSPLAAFDANTLYGGSAKGYTDYPALAEPAMA